MRAVTAAGAADGVRLDLLSLPDPSPRPDEVEVEVSFVALGLVDLLLMEGRYQRQVPEPFVPGSEFSGTVAAVGSGVEWPRPGDAVIGRALHGALAERLVVPTGSLSPAPAGLTAVEAACLPVTYVTALHALDSVAGVRPGEWVVVLGAARGTGLAAIDLAGRLDARPVAVATLRPEEVARVDRLVAAAARLRRCSDRASRGGGGFDQGTADDRAGGDRGRPVRRPSDHARHR